MDKNIKELMKKVFLDNISCLEIDFLAQEILSNNIGKEDILLSYLL